MMIDTRAVLDFWFGDIRAGWITDAGKPKLWFGGKSAADDEIKTRFGAMIKTALAEETKTVRADDASSGADIIKAESVLARIILLDQMTRMIYRGESRAFVGDDKALALCRAGLTSGADKLLPPVQRQFFYLPLEHSEQMEDQILCVSLFESMLGTFPQYHNHLAAALEYAVKHRDIINRFGRFPHRNKALLRDSTAEELEYLQTAEKFGQG